MDDVNVVLVLSEAFSDPEQLEGVEYAEDPIPRTRRTMQATTSGSMLAQLFGGGTANMEFETLTGMSLSQFNPQMQTPYQMLVDEYDTFPSAVGYLAAQGHRPIAIHPYMTGMYKRETVYPILGFDEFLGEDEIEDAAAHRRREVHLRRLGLRAGGARDRAVRRTTAGQSGDDAEPLPDEGPVRRPPPGDRPRPARSRRRPRATAAA